MKKRAIIACAGNGLRWNNYLGIQKHFIEIDGERILDRTVRLLRENGVDDIYIVGKDSSYEVDGAKLYIPKLTPENGDADKFLSSKDLWLRYGDGGGKTIFLFGDVYFTEYAMRKIVNNYHPDWLCFGRALVSEFTKRNGEIFAQTFYDGQVDQHERALLKLVEYFKNNKIAGAGGWGHYRIMIGIPEKMIDSQLVGGQFVELNDWTDDFDEPGNYEGYVHNRKMFKNCHICGGNKI